MRRIEKITTVPAFLVPLKERINELIDQVNELAKLDGDQRTVVIENGVISLIPKDPPAAAAVSSEAETHYFTVIDTSERDGENITPKIKVINGSSPDSSIAGYVDINGSSRSVSAVEWELDPPVFGGVLDAGTVFLELDQFNNPFLYLHKQSDGSSITKSRRSAVASVGVNGDGSIRIYQNYNGGALPAFTTYSGPFATKWIESSDEIYVWAGRVYVANTSIYVPAQTFTRLTESEYTFIYLDIAYSSGAYIATLVCADDVPSVAPTNHMYVIVGAVRHYTIGEFFPTTYCYDVQHLENDYTVTERIV